jgi:hypothetical protein
MEANGRPGAALAAPPLLSLQPLDQFCVFTVPKPTPHEIPRGYIVSFRLRLFQRRRLQQLDPRGGRWAPACGPAA